MTLYQPKKKEHFEKKLLANGIVLPRRKAVSEATGEKSSLFIGDLQIGKDTIAKGVSFDLSKMLTADGFNAQLNKLTGNMHSVMFEGTKANYLGVLQMILFRLNGAPYYKNVGITQGLYRFQDEWYHVDSQGSRDKNWQPTPNVEMDSVAYAAGQPKQTLSTKIPFDLVPESEIPELILLINNPKFIYPLIGWSVSTFFRKRFKALKSAGKVHLDNDPVCFLTGLAGSGKTETVKRIIKPLFSFPMEELEIPGETLNTIRTQLLLQTNSFVSLDETKNALLNTRGGASITEADVAGLVRAAWSGAPYSRGTPDGPKSFPFDTALMLIGPYVPPTFDPAMKERLLVVVGDPNESSKHTYHWDRLVEKETKVTDFLGRLGATIVRETLTLSDEEIVLIYTKAEELVDRHTEIKDRRRYGVIKAVFGNIILFQILGNIWNKNKFVSACCGDVPIESAPVKRVTDEWSQTMEAMLNLCGTEVTLSERLIVGHGYYFEKNSFWLNVRLAFDKLLRKGFKSIMEPHQFIMLAGKKGLLQRTGGTHMFEEFKTWGVNSRSVKGPWIKMNMKEMSFPRDKSQQSFAFQNLDGFKPGEGVR